MPAGECVFYFVKKNKGTNVLETKIKVSKTQKETGRTYKFKKTHIWLEIARNVNQVYQSRTTSFKSDVQRPKPHSENQ